MDSCIKREKTNEQTYKKKTQKRKKLNRFRNGFLYMEKEWIDLG